MQYSTFYAKLTPNGAVAGTKYSVSVAGVTAIVDGQKIYGSTAIYFAIKPKSSGTATITFRNDTTGDIIGTRQIVIRSTTLAKPTYTLSASATSVNEGGTVTFTVDTTDVLVNTNIPYTITGVSLTDISLPSLTGNAVVLQNGQAVVVCAITDDGLTEGVETLLFTLDGKGLSKTVTINDTSIQRTYSYGLYKDTTDTTEITNFGIRDGGSVVFRVGKYVKTGDSAGTSFNGFTLPHDTIIYHDLPIIGELISDDLYIKGIKLDVFIFDGSYFDPIIQNYDYMNYHLGGKNISRYLINLDYLSYRMKFTNLENGDVRYSNNTYQLDAPNSDSTNIFGISQETRDVILNNLLIPGHRVRVELEYL